MNTIRRLNINSIIENLMRKLPPTISVERETVIENTYEALKKIGIRQNNEYTSVLYLESNKVKLPEWIDEIQQVLYLDAVNSDDIEEQLIYYINKAKPMSLVSNFIHDRNTYDYKYLMRDGYLHSNISTGYIIIIYTAIALDENNEPLIDDEINLIEAIVWYNIMQFMWQATIRNPQSFSPIYAEAQRQWGYYAINAKTASIMPKNEDELRGLFKKYLSLLPNLKV